MKLGFLSKHFPPPRYLKPQHIGISFSDSNIKAIYFDKSSKEPSLRSAVVSLDNGAISSGVIHNMDEVVKKLSLVREQFGSPFVFFTVPDELAYVFSTSTTVAHGHDAYENVAFVIEENVPLSLSETTFDFVPTSRERAESEYKAQCVVAACVKQEVSKFIEALKRAHFEPVGCIHESQAIARAILSQGFGDTAAIVHARGNRVGIYLVKNGLVYFSTLRNVGHDDYKYTFLDEYRKFLDYCLKISDSQQNNPEHVFVCGEFEYAKEIVEAMIDSSKELKSIKLSNVWTNVFEIDKHLPEIPYEQSLNFAGPIGAVLSDIV